MRIAVIGAGAMGSMFGGRLAATKAHDVWLVDPWDEHVEAMQKHGLEILAPDGSTERIDVRATTNPATVQSPVDLALIFVKGHATREAGEQAEPLLSQDGLALTLQNGVGNLNVLMDIVGEDRAIQGVTSHGATILGPGRVRHAGTGPTHLAQSEHVPPEKIDAVAAALTDAGIETDMVDSLDSLIWGKLIVNVGINALTALLQVHNGALPETEACRRLVHTAVAEAVAVADARGTALPYDRPVEHVLDVARKTGANRSSMLADVLRGAPTEIDTINGAVVREGERLGVPTPVNAVLVSLIRAVEATYGRRIRTN